MKLTRIYPLFLLVFMSCHRQVPIDDIQNEPKEVPADRSLADVYQSLDGEWEGEFLIFEDTAHQVKNDQLLYSINKQLWGDLPIKLVSKVEVNQKYDSKSPYFQTVTITDYYPESKQTAVSQGVNKVQDGKMWCVVRKPDDTVIHEGSLEGSRTIIWQRNRPKPQSIEYFRETVLKDTYSIIGWGYYEGDDLEKMPKYWFLAEYNRVK